MLRGKHYLLLFIAALLVGNQIIRAADIENDKAVNKSDASEIDTSISLPEEDEKNMEDPQLAQSPWTLFGNQYGSMMSPIDNPFQQTFGLYFPALYTFSTWARGLNSNLLGSPLLSSTSDSNTDSMPSASKVVLMLADDKRNVKRSPIFPPELLRQVRQSQDPFSQLLSQTLGQVSQGMGQILGQAQNTDSNPDDSQQNQLQQLLSQTLSQLNQFGQMNQPLPNSVAQLLGQPQNSAGSDDGSQTSDSIVGQAQNSPFALQNMFPGLNQMFGSSSEISEVRVKPNTEARPEEVIAADKMNQMKLNMLLLQTLNDKKRPILWFRDAKRTNDAEYKKKTPEEILLEQKLLAFERQVIRELRLLQEIERQARQMQTASKGMYAKVTKGSEYKVNYPLNQKPVHKITLEDIEKSLADEFVREMLQKKAEMQETGKNIKRHSHQTSNFQTLPFNKEEAAQILGYALRGVTDTKDAAQNSAQWADYYSSFAPERTQESHFRKEPLVTQQKFDDKDFNMDMGNYAEIQSIDQLQKNWMQPQNNEAQIRWAAEKMNMQQQERTQDQQNPMQNSGKTETDNVQENEQNNESERIKIHKKIFGLKGEGISRPVNHYHYYLPSRSDYNTYQATKYDSGYNSGGSYTGPSYSSGPSYSPSYRTATGDEEIHKLLETDPAWTKLNWRTTLQEQQQQQQQTQKNTAMTDITSSNGRTTRLAPNIRFWLLLGEQNKKPAAGNRRKRHAGQPSLQTIDEKALNELRATYKGALKEITLLPNEDPSDALMRYNSAAVQDVMLNSQGQPIEIDTHADQAGLRNNMHTINGNSYDSNQPIVVYPPNNANLYTTPNIYDKIAHKEHMVLPQMSTGATLTAIEASALFDSRNITQSLVSSVLAEVNRRLTNCCTKCKDSILEDIKEKLRRNEQTEAKEDIVTEQPNNAEQYFQDWLGYMKSNGYDSKRLTKTHYDDFLQYNKLSHFDLKNTNTIKREITYTNLSEENTNDKTGKYLRRHIPQRVVVEQISGEPDIVNQTNLEEAQDLHYNLVYNLKHDHEIDSKEKLPSDFEMVTSTSTTKPRRRLRRRKHKKIATTTNSTTILPTNETSITTTVATPTTIIQSN